MYKTAYILWIGALLCLGCNDESQSPVHDETPFELEYSWFQKPKIPSDNLLTKEKVQLGRMLFYDDQLSENGDISCASCHRQSDAFAYKGEQIQPGERQSMPLFNLAWHRKGFYWDGRADSLRNLVLDHLADQQIMAANLSNVVTIVNARANYQDQLMRAYGRSEINARTLSLALEQFLLSIVSNNSKYDRYLVGSQELTESEARGRFLYHSEYTPRFPDQSGADCLHCHGGSNYQLYFYANNGIDDESSYTDLGRELYTNNPDDRGKFKIPSLRNLGFSGSYMRDGRFTNLEQIIEHYNSNTLASPSLDPNLEKSRMTGLFLSDQDIQDVSNFLLTLNDSSLITNPAYSNPF